MDSVGIEGVREKKRAYHLIERNMNVGMWTGKGACVLVCKKRGEGFSLWAKSGCVFK